MNLKEWWRMHVTLSFDARYPCRRSESLFTFCANTEHQNSAPTNILTSSRGHITKHYAAQMDYNSARMSQQFRSQSQPNGGGRSKQQQTDPDAFMRLVGPTPYPRQATLHMQFTNHTHSFRQIAKSQAASATSASNSPTRTCRSPTRSRYRRFSNGLPNCS